MHVHAAVRFHKPTQLHAAMPLNPSLSSALSGLAHCCPRPGPRTAAGPLPNQELCFWRFAPQPRCRLAAARAGIATVIRAPSVAQALSQDEGAVTRPKGRGRAPEEPAQLGGLATWVPPGSQANPASTGPGPGLEAIRNHASHGPRKTRGWMDEEGKAHRGGPWSQPPCGCLHGCMCGTTSARTPGHTQRSTHRRRP